MSHNIELNDVVNVDTYIEMDTINCCICLDNEYIDFVNLTCCNKKIHKTCLLKWIVDDNNKELSCPMCRSKMIYLNTIIDLFEMISFLEENAIHISIAKGKMIIKELYETSFIYKLVEYNNSYIDSEIYRYNFYNTMIFTISCWVLIGLIGTTFFIMIRG